MDGSFEQQVRQRAYQIWVDMGQADGMAHDHWIAAERDLLARPAKPRKARVSAPRAKAATPKEAPAKAQRAKTAKVGKAN